MPGHPEITGWQVTGCSTGGAGTGNPAICCTTLSASLSLPTKFWCDPFDFPPDLILFFEIHSQQKNLSILLQARPRGRKGHTPTSAVPPRLDHLPELIANKKTLHETCEATPASSPTHQVRRPCQTLYSHLIPCSQITVEFPAPPTSHKHPAFGVQLPGPFPYPRTYRTLTNRRLSVCRLGGYSSRSQSLEYSYGVNYTTLYAFVKDNLLSVLCQLPPASFTG